MDPKNRFSVFLNDDDEIEEGEIVESVIEKNIAILRSQGLAFHKEQQKGKKMSWGDWCWTAEDDEHIARTLHY